jgi:uncharacterized protein YqeY
MPLLEQIRADLTAAMRSGDDTRKTALRQLLAGVRQAELDKRTAAAKAHRGALGPEQLAALEQTSLDEAEVIAVIQREAKSRRESIADSQRANRADLVAANEAELGLIEAYLPRQLSRAELESLARAAIAEAGATGPKQLGAVMKVLTPRVKGQADGRMVSEVVRELLGG